MRTDSVDLFSARRPKKIDKRRKVPERPPQATSCLLRKLYNAPLLRPKREALDIARDRLDQRRDLTLVVGVERAHGGGRAFDEGAEDAAPLEDVAHERMVFEQDQRQQAAVQIARARL